MKIKNATFASKKLYIITSLSAVILIAGITAILIAHSNLTQADINIIDMHPKTSKPAKVEFPEIQNRQITYVSGTPILNDDKYIEINLTEQKLYAWEDGKVVNSFLVSSGLSGATPVGTFAIYSRSRSSLMEGPGYYLPNVEWVNRFTGHYSIHGTYWHNNFGHPMSHGCVNASNADAQYIYTWAPMGTQVVIHY